MRTANNEYGVCDKKRIIVQVCSLDLSVESLIFAQSTSTSYEMTDYEKIPSDTRLHFITLLASFSLEEKETLKLVQERKLKDCTRSLKRLQNATKKLWKRIEVWNSCEEELTCCENMKALRKFVIRFLLLASIDAMYEDKIREALCECRKEGLDQVMRKIARDESTKDLFYKINLEFTDKAVQIKNALEESNLNKALNLFADKSDEVYLECKESMTERQVEATFIWQLLIFYLLLILLRSAEEFDFIPENIETNSQLSLRPFDDVDKSILIITPTILNQKGRREILTLTHDSLKNLEDQVKDLTKQIEQDLCLDLMKQVIVFAMALILKNDKLKTSSVEVLADLIRIVLSKLQSEMMKEENRFLINQFEECKIILHDMGRQRYEMTILVIAMCCGFYGSLSSTKGEEKLFLYQFLALELAVKLKIELNCEKLPDVTEADASFKSLTTETKVFILSMVCIFMMENSEKAYLIASKCNCFKKVTEENYDYVKQFTGFALSRFSINGRSLASYLKPMLLITLVLLLSEQIDISAKCKFLKIVINQYIVKVLGRLSQTQAFKKVIIKFQFKYRNIVHFLKIGQSDSAEQLFVSYMNDLNQEWHKATEDSVILEFVIYQLLSYFILYLLMAGLNGQVTTQLLPFIEEQKADEQEVKELKQEEEAGSKEEGESDEEGERESDDEEEAESDEEGDSYAGVKLHEPTISNPKNKKTCLPSQFKT
ncbi:hypothetical protein Ciccas_013435 [Cichlidogyrus casuarinus]|uniref:Uncharacterized protein n=1 Tax=Cichlidogyrus casuarinus TaxID=1844966 RepID=A0ABD2PLU5_9PLAT